MGILAASVFSIVLFQEGYAQCVDHPEGKTALRLNNETRYNLTFFIDEYEKEVVPPRTVGAEWEVEADEHILRARATIRREHFWVYIGNEVPKG